MTKSYCILKRKLHRKCYIKNIVKSIKKVTTVPTLLRISPIPQ